MLILENWSKSQIAGIKTGIPVPNPDSIPLIFSYKYLIRNFELFKDLNDTELFRMLADRAIESTEQIDKPDGDSIENGHKLYLTERKIIYDFSDLSVYLSKLIFKIWHYTLLIKTRQLLLDYSKSPET